MEQLIKQCEKIKFDTESSKNAKRRWDNIAKPIGSLGLLEDAVIQLAGIQGSEHVKVTHPTVIVACADNGVVQEGVTQTGSEVTAIVAGNLLQGNTSVCIMAKRAGVTVLPVDVGMLTDVPNLRCEKTRYGTENMVHAPAMTQEDVLHAINTGIRLVKEQKQAGCTLIATGEMGIGNTTTSSAVASVLLGETPETTTGRGAGLDDSGLARKIKVIQKAIALHHPNPQNPIDVLQKVGGLDLATLCGVFLGGAMYGVAVLVDGVIASVSALCAARICPSVRDFMIASHISHEPTAKLIVKELKLRPFLQANLCLGEGTGAVAVIPILQMAVDVYEQMSTFEEIRVDAYEDYTKK